MAYFWEQISTEDKKIIIQFKESLELIDSNDFLISTSSSQDEENESISNHLTTPYSIAEKVGINLHVYSKDGPVLQAIWVYFLLKLKSIIPTESLKYQNVDEFLKQYPEFLSKDEEEQINLFHTANWMFELFKFIPAYKNKGLTIMIVPKLVEGWEAKYITGSGQKEVTANRVKIFEREGNVKPNARGKQTYKNKVIPAPKAKSAKRFHKVKKVSRSTYEPVSRREGLRQHAHKTYEEHDLTDEENSSTHTRSTHTTKHRVVHPPSSVYTGHLNPSQELSIPDDEFMEALALFRQNSSNGALQLSLSRANSLSLSRHTSSLGLDAKSSLIDFDKFAVPLSPHLSVSINNWATLNNANNSNNGNGNVFGSLNYNSNGNINNNSTNNIDFYNNGNTLSQLFNNHSNGVSNFSVPSSAIITNNGSLAPLSPSTLNINANNSNSNINYFDTSSPRNSNVGLPCDI